ncbi:MAG: molybdopterin-synthase adenylyltransferase MoeB [Gemmatimonadota bacterium]|nr:molybdopterin-synthase adenylyltransferase MoeB [Gemmatimonadota bacterium]
MEGGDTGPSLTREELARYARHLVLPEVGKAGQERLKHARVLLVGAGGLGSPAALYLAAAGVGTLGIVDPDVVDVTNLQRQILHGTGGLGAPKVDSARERLTDVNPHVQLQTGAVRLSSDNALEIFAGFDVVVDGSDNFPTRYLVNDACVLTGKPNVYGSVYRWEGQLSVFAADEGPCYRCLFREPPPPGLIPNCAEAGVFGALPGVIGAAQAMETVKLLLGVGEPLVGRLQIFDALSYRWRELEIRRDPDCPVCGDQPTQTGLIDYEVFCGVAPEVPVDESAVGRVEADELAGAMAGDPRPFLLDVREPMEWQMMNLAELGAVLVPMGEVGERLEEIPRDRPVVVYCHTGVRSLKVAEALVEEGYEDVRNLEGGIVGVLG